VFWVFEAVDLRGDERKLIMNEKKMRRANWMAMALTIFGCTAMLGDVAGSMVLKGVGAASLVAPFPKVFCDNQGLEGFASDFTIVAENADGGETRIALTPEMYAQMRGPYNRRNVYGAAISFGPKLPDEMWRSVFEYGLGTNGVLPAEFGMPLNSTNLSVVVRTRTRGRSDEWKLSAQ